MGFEIVGDIRHVETFASGSGIRELPRLRRVYGPDNWRKRKGVTAVKLEDEVIRTAEVHWYEAARSWPVRVQDKTLPGRLP